jgi:hypothetical protein
MRQITPLGLPRWLAGFCTTGSRASAPLARGGHEGTPQRAARHADRRATFLDDLTGTRLLHSVISQVLEFTADEYYSIAAARK